MQGAVIGTYFAVSTIAQSFGPMICAELAKLTGAVTNPAAYGPLITGLVALGYTCTVPIWWKAGKEFTKRVESREKAAKAA